MAFPYHTVPDGSVWYAHHFVYAAIAVLVVALVHWDDYQRREPIGVFGGVVLSLFAWHYLWATNRPVTGAILTVAGLAIATTSAIVQPVWNRYYPGRSRLAVLILLYVSWDDVLQHAFGWPMPLDVLWKSGLAHLFP